MDTAVDVCLAGKPIGDVSHLYHDECRNSRPAAAGRFDSVPAGNIGAQIQLALNNHRAAMAEQALVGSDADLRTFYLPVTRFTA